MNETTKNGQFGRYEVLDEIGAGGFAVVYRAWDPGLDREVAIKALRPHAAADPEVRQRFLAEARAVARLRHPNIVTVHDVGEANDRPFFAMEMIEGPTLAGLLVDGQGLPLDRVRSILKSLCSAIDYVHAAGLVHRDVKPANVMLDRSARVVLMDFGIVRVLDSTQYTRSGAGLGTPEAMSPEQVRDEPVGPAADIYALGVLTYQLLAGQPPFVGGLVHILHAHAYEAPPDLRVARPDIPDAVCAAIGAALAKDPAARPGSALELAEAMGGPAPPRAAPNRDSSPTTPQRRRYIVVRRESGAEPSEDPWALPTAPRMHYPAVTVLAGSGIKGFADGARGAAQFSMPFGVAVDGSGNVYVADAGNHRIRKILAGGPVATLAGTGERGLVDGPCAEARFNNPAGIAVDRLGNVYVADWGNHCVRRITPERVVVTEAGSGSQGLSDGWGDEAQFSGPNSVAAGADGSLYVADTDNHCIRMISVTQAVTTLAGSGEQGFADGVGKQARFDSPIGVAVDQAGNVYVSDWGNHCIRKITSRGVVSTLAGTDKEGLADGQGRSARFDDPAGVAVDSQGNLFVSDCDNHRVCRITPDGVVTTIAGPPVAGATDTAQSSIQLHEPAGLALDRAGYLYVAEWSGHRIWKITLGERAQV